ncbi:cobalamin (vitamin B12) biosynthesis protein CbiM [Thermincola ferriacetica]|uniref:Cobalamin (Vitamin B12) biosynthesis protein CbiM n=1 Tax=Thermincola ferriacetica TaxID=281456 RepID=A0A0L6W6V7_9FIRM|nr:energy-coupling factor ABC transporter permease [Thermincola ferriacetica]KNZ71108.1 cobalamin (vitamin B12) biosynthesis protein CbiM [Thermincola ferriacetica]
MHIPDGFLDTKTWLSAYAISGGSLLYSAKKVKETLNERMVPKMGVMAAFIFAAQMVNFPVAGGTSGHLIGAALAAITLGPWAATLIMSAVLIVQCFFFLDGGVTALGANILLMGIVAPWVAYGLYRIIAGGAPTKTRFLIASFVASWASTFVASLVCTVLLALSGTIPMQVGLPAMAGWHALIGIGEGIITTVVLGYLTQVKAEIVSQTESV